MKNQHINTSNKTHMSKIVYTILLTLFVSANLFAQRLDREKIKALKIAHITEQLDLTKAEAQKFWPVYNANEEAENKLRVASNERRKNRDVDALSESEAKALLLDIENAEKKKVQLRSKMLNDLLEIMPAKKIIKLYQAERSFRNKIFNEYKKRHANRDRNHP